MIISQRLTMIGLFFTAVLLTTACESTYYRSKSRVGDRFAVHLTPQQMVPFRWNPPLTAADSPTAASIPSPRAKPQPRPLPAVSGSGGEAPESAQGAVLSRPLSMTEAVDAIIADHQAEGDGDGFSLNAVETYDYQYGAVYPVVTSPGFVTVVELEPGESVMNVAGGDTANWLIDTIDGAHEGQVRTNVLIKPRRPFLQTNLILTTDRRTYHLAARSLDSTTYHTAVNWTYAADAMVVRRKSTKEVVQAIETRRPAHAGADVNYGYFVLTQHGVPRPVWTPLRVYDDGRQVTIEFTPESRNFARPVLFNRSPGGQLQLINYRMDGDRSITQTLFHEAELKLGTSVVRITRAGFRYYAQPPLHSKFSVVPKS